MYRVYNVWLYVACDKLIIRWYFLYGMWRLPPGLCEINHKRWDNIYSISSVIKAVILMPAWMSQSDYVIVVNLISSSHNSLLLLTSTLFLRRPFVPSLRPDLSRRIQFLSSALGFLKINPYPSAPLYFPDPRLSLAPQYSPSKAIVTAGRRGESCA